MIRTVRIASVTCLVLCLAAPRVAAQADPAVAGQWTSVAPLPFSSTALHLLPTGMVMFYGVAAAGNNVRLWDPATAITSLIPLPGFNVFCSGHTLLADGRLFIVGGHIVNNVGLPNSSSYDAVNNVWAAGPNMNAGRWYPTATSLANGDVLVLSGEIDSTIGRNLLPQVFQAASGTWRDLTSAQLRLNNYPRMHLAPNGKVFNSAPTQTTRYLDTSGTGAWTVVATRNFGPRDRGSSVMYDDGKVLVMGGGDPPTNTAEVIDLNASSPSWRLVAPMAFARRMLNATLLPDGKVLVTGGSYGAGTNNASTPAYAAEMWDPGTERWTTMASAQAVRIYHSAALLLPDGRVLTTGGDGITQVELYSPPYLFAGARPTITAAPAVVSLGQSFFVETPEAASITRVTWIRLPSVTHAFDMNQRINSLSVSQAVGGVDVVAPSNANLAPLGDYMLFILNGNGVPSVARIVRLVASTGGNQAPVVNAGADQTITLPSTASLTGTATDDGQPNPPGTLTRTWSQVSGPGTVSFGDANAISTSAAFSMSGAYVLRLTVSDGAITVSDDVAVTVNPAAPGATGTGLTGQYYNDPDTGARFGTLVFTRTDATVNFTWGNDSPGPGVNIDKFSVRWTGQVLAPVTGNYTFSTVSNDGVRLWVNGQLVINNWTVHGTTTNTSAAIALVAGVKYAITMEYFDNAGWGVAKLLWAYPGQAQTVIPQSRLYPAVASPNQAPVVNAGADQTITLPSTASLTGTATDDGQPNPPGTLTRTWSQVSGPGTVSFGDANAISTSAAFSMSGAYVLRLTVSDGAITVSDDVAVTVNPAAPGATGTGLTGQYYNDPDTGARFGTLVFTRTDATVNFTWGNDSPGPGVNIDKFSVRWTGQVLAPVTGNYTFSTVSNDGVRLWVNGQLVINNWTVHGTTTNTSAAIALVAGVKYAITMEYFDNVGWGVAKLLWAYPGQAQTIIPQARLFP